MERDEKIIDDQLVEYSYEYDEGEPDVGILPGYHVQIDAVFEIVDLEKDEFKKLEEYDEATLIDIVVSSLRD